MLLGHHERRHDARAVARVDAGLLDVLHDAADDDGARSRRRRSRRRTRRRPRGTCRSAPGRSCETSTAPRHVAIERRRVVDDRHAAPAEHVRRTDDDRESRSLAAASRASLREVAVPLAGCGMPRSHSSCANRWRSSARSIESGDVPRILTPAACSGSASFSGVCPPNCTTHDTSAPADALSLDARPSRPRT